MRYGRGMVRAQVQVRLSEEELALLDDEVQARRVSDPRQVWTRSSVLRAFILEHAGRKKRRT